jgi:hypothetical protein
MEESSSNFWVMMGPKRRKSTTGTFIFLGTIQSLDNRDDVT